MKIQRVKIKYKILLIIITAFCVLLRILYVNEIKYPTALPQTYVLNETVDYGNFNIYVSEYTVYNGNELQEKVTGNASEYADETELVLNIHVKNKSNDKTKFELSTFTLEYDYLSGGGINPVLFDLFNPDLSSLEFEPNEEKTIMLPYPLIDKNPHLLLSLYPQKIIIELE